MTSEIESKDIPIQSCNRNKSTYERETKKKGSLTKKVDKEIKEEIEEEIELTNEELKAELFQLKKKLIINEKKKVGFSKGYKKKELLKNLGLYARKKKEGGASFNDLKTFLVTYCEYQESVNKNNLKKQNILKNLFDVLIEDLNIQTNENKLQTDVDRLVKDFERVEKKNFKWETKYEDLREEAQNKFSKQEKQIQKFQKTIIEQKVLLKELKNRGGKYDDIICDYEKIKDTNVLLKNTLEKNIIFIKDLKKENKKLNKLIKENIELKNKNEKLSIYYSASRQKLKDNGINCGLNRYMK